MTTEQKIDYVTLTAGLLGAVKIILQALGYDIIDDNQINTLANGIGIIFTILGVMMSHRKGDVNYREADQTGE